MTQLLKIINQPCCEQFHINSPLAAFLALPLHPCARGHVYLVQYEFLFPAIALWFIAWCVTGVVFFDSVFMWTLTARQISSLLYYLHLNAYFKYIYQKYCPSLLTLPPNVLLPLSQCRWKLTQYTPWTSRPQNHRKLLLNNSEATCFLEMYFYSWATNVWILLQTVTLVYSCCFMSLPWPQQQMKKGGSRTPWAKTFSAVCFRSHPASVWDVCV